MTRMIYTKRGLVGILAALVVGLVSLTATLAFVSQNSVTESEVPTSIAGHEVVYVKSKANTVCYNSDRATLVLRAKEDTLRGYISGPSLSEVRSELSRKGWSDIYRVAFLGPGTSKEELIELHERYNEEDRRFGCSQLKTGPTEGYSQ